jgi:hypothetical protein
VIYGLAAALGWGLSDLWAAISGRRIGSGRTVVVAQVAALRAALDANTELDVMIETANLPARDEFRRITQEEGLKAAIAWRDSRYRGTE